MTSAYSTLEIRLFETDQSHQPISLLLNQGTPAPQHYRPPASSWSVVSLNQRYIRSKLAEN